MALGSQNQNNGKIYFIKVATQDADKKKLDSPVFQVVEKGVDGKYVITSNVPSVSGKVNKIEIKQGEWEGNKYHTVSLSLKDDEVDELYVVDFKMNMMNRSIFNALLNADLSKEVKIGLYTSKKGYPAASVRQGENMINWKYSLDQVPAPEEVKFKGKIQRDYTETDNFFVSKLTELAKTVVPEVSQVKKVKVEKVPENKTPVDSDGDMGTEGKDEDLF